jgi:hypothetical protein
MNQDGDFVWRSGIGVVLQACVVARLEVLRCWKASKLTRLSGPPMDAIDGGDDGALKAMTATGISASTRSKARTPTSTLNMALL